MEWADARAYRIAITLAVLAIAARNAGLDLVEERRFLYGLNTIFVAEKRRG